uniref:Uncharacterized protein n=1 Tax=Steinernema glaseri TaxID=37863 RepID=A0A1I7Z959_9BILA
MSKCSDPDCIDQTSSKMVLQDLEGGGHLRTTDSLQARPKTLKNGNQAELTMSKCAEKRKANKCLFPRVVSRRRLESLFLEDDFIQ